MDSQLSQQLGQTIKVANSTAVNSDGESVYGATVSHSGRVIDRMVMMHSPQGERFVSERQIVLPATALITSNTLVYLPGETSSANSGWPIAAYALRVGENSSSDHWKVWLGGVTRDSAGR